jgi:ABC-type multidrug transport system permease subunit
MSQPTAPAPSSTPGKPSIPTSHQAPARYSPLGQLVLARLREFYREPEAIFWVYGFPILLTLALGIAFRNKPVEQINVTIQEGPGAEAAAEALNDYESKQVKFVARRLDAEAAALRLRTGKTELVVIPSDSGEDGHERGYEYVYDPTRAESLLARNAVDDVLQRAAGRQDKYPPSERQMLEPGGRYIDFLVPGLLGMSLMGGGLWGVGFVIVDMRIRKLLKRFLATPMQKRDFLAGIMLSRLIFLIPDVLFLLVFAWLAFGVVIQGSLLAVVFLVLLGAFTFSGIGLLVASRAKTIEAVSGMMNVVMLPQWVLSGIFFSSERFPEAAQPYLKFIPLTPLNDALRAVMLEGKPLTSQLLEIGIVAAWGVVTFVLALRWFRWT